MRTTCSYSISLIEGLRSGLGRFPGGRRAITLCRRARMSPQYSPRMSQAGSRHRSRPDECRRSPTPMGCRGFPRQQAWKEKRWSSPRRPPSPGEAARSPGQPPGEAATPLPAPSVSGPTSTPGSPAVPLQVVDLNLIDQGEGLGVRLFGLARNIGQVPPNYAQFTIIFLDQAGAVVDKRVAIMATRILPPGKSLHST